MPITIEIIFVHNDLPIYIAIICCWWGHFPFLHRIRYPPYTQKKGSIVRWIMKKKPQKSGIRTLIPYFLFGTIFAVLFKVNKVISLLIVTGKQKLFISFCIILISCFNYSIYICGILDFFYPFFIFEIESRKNIYATFFLNQKCTLCTAFYTSICIFAWLCSFLLFLDHNEFSITFCLLLNFSLSKMKIQFS